MDDPRSDEALMLAYRDGEASAFERLYARHRGKLYRYLLHQCDRRGDAEEMFQEIWMSVIRARSGYQATARFSTWLYRIAHNRLVDGFRVRGRLAEFESDAAGDDLPEPPAPACERPDKRLERAELAARLVAAIAELPLAQRDAFLLANEGGLSVEEIAEACGCGFETAKSRLRYAYARLRAGLGDWR